MTTCNCPSTCTCASEAAAGAVLGVLAGVLLLGCIAAACSSAASSASDPLPPPPKKPPPLPPPPAPSYASQGRSLPARPAVITTHGERVETRRKKRKAGRHSDQFRLLPAPRPVGVGGPLAAATLSLVGILILLASGLVPVPPRVADEVGELRTAVERSLQSASAGSSVQAGSTWP